MALSNSYNYTTQTSQIIARALRIIGVQAQGETTPANASSEALYTLNEIFKEWQADGLQLWKTATVPLTGIIAGATATIGAVGQNITYQAPFKVLHVYHRNTASGTDTPLIHVTKDEYARLTPKATDGIPTQWYYKPPTAKSATVDSSNHSGLFYWFPALSADFIADYTMHAEMVLPLMDFDSTSDQPDIPDYMVNALVWALADQLSYEYGVGLQERDRIGAKARFHKANALSFDQEEGSLYIVPEPRWDE